MSQFGKMGVLSPEVLRKFEVQKTLKTSANVLTDLKLPGHKMASLPVLMDSFTFYVICRQLLDNKHHFPPVKHSTTRN